MNNNTIKGCSKTRPCKEWRVCSYCAARRQAHLANIAERLAAETGDLSWTILYPRAKGEGALIKARESWTRDAKPAGALWTVEQSRTGALHLNIIHPTDQGGSTKQAEQWTREIVGNVRNVAAYIGKRGQAPRREDFSGRTSGTSGTLWKWLTDAHASPIVAAAAIQQKLNGTGRACKVEQTGKGAKPETREDFARIAAKHLPDLWRLVGKTV